MMKSKKRGNLTIILWFAYVALAGVCVLLTYKTSVDDIYSVLINAILFVIVGIIFIFANKDFKKVIDITKALDNASSKISADYVQKQEMLLEHYRNNKNTNIFTGTFFADIFLSYLNEADRLALNTNEINNCDINDYINKEVIDSAARKNLLNLVTGVMTGLGILGTFVGLTIGLQFFTTGSAADIEESIPRLMDGIKIAFHTSIYGMSFSLLFNFVYKDTMERVYNALDDFLLVFNKYVCSDIENEANTYLQRSLKQLPEAIATEIGKQLNSSLVEIISTMDNRMKVEAENTEKRFANTIIPQMNQMNESLVKLANNIREDQDETMKQLITLFTEQMNDSLGQSFAELRTVIEETAEIQRQNNQFAEKVLPLISDINKCTEQIHELSKNTIEGMSEYVNRINELQNVINQNFIEVGVQLADQAEINEKLNSQVSILVDFEKQFTEASEKFTSDIAKSIESLNTFEQSISDNAENSMKMLTDAAKNNTDVLNKAVEECTDKIANDCAERMKGLVDSANYGLDKFSTTIETCTKNITEECSNAMKELVESVNEELEEINKISVTTTNNMEIASDKLAQALENLNTDVIKSFKTGLDDFDNVLTEICKKLSGTIAEVEATTSKVPRVVDDSYKGINEGFTKLRGKIEGLILAVDDMRRTVKEWNEMTEK